MKVIKLESDKFDEIKLLFKDIFMNAPWNEDWSNDDQLTEYMLDLMGNRNSLAIGLYDENELIGFSLGSIMHWCMGTEYYIYEFCIKRERQHNGLGTLFLNEIEAYVKNLGIDDIFLQTDKNVPAYEFYKKNGFSELEGHVSLTKRFDLMNERTINEKIRFFEEISSNAHVALNTMQYDGWIMRFANGYTNRANSVSVIYPSMISFDVKVSYCEEIYKRAKLPCVFKLTEEDNELNEYLEAHGYEAVTPTDVMILDLKDKTFQKGTCVFSKEPTEEWVRAFFAFEGIVDITKQGTFRQMLSKVLVETIYCSVIKDGEVIACASAAMEHGYMLLQNVVVSPAYRGQGYGRAVCESLVAQAKENGAHHAYLQVVKENAVAVNMYLKLGYEKAYTYWYMKK